MSMREKLIKAMRLRIFHAVPREEAEAAIDAVLDTLREPTPEMIEAARTAWLESAADYTRLSESMAAAFTAAIDSAKGGL